MGENKESFRNELEKLANISELFDNSVLGRGETKIICELNKDDYQKIISNFGDVYRNLEKIVINISNINFTFVLKK